MIIDTLNKQCRRNGPEAMLHSDGAIYSYYYYYYYIILYLLLLSFRLIITTKIIIGTNKNDNNKNIIIQMIRMMEMLIRRISTTITPKQKFNKFLKLFYLGISYYCSFINTTFAFLRHYFRSFFINIIIDFFL